MIKIPDVIDWSEPITVKCKIDNTIIQTNGKHNKSMFEGTDDKGCFSSMWFKIAFYQVESKNMKVGDTFRVFEVVKAEKHFLSLIGKTGICLKAKFIGSNSLGYEKDKFYHLEFSVSTDMLFISRVGDFGLRKYTSLKSFLNNWEVIS